MIEMACPSCGRAGQVPKEKLHTRLVCRKCHSVFHVDSAGRTLVGEPVSAAAKEKLKKEGEPKGILKTLHIPTLQDLTSAGDNLSDYTFPVKPVLGALGGLVGVWVLWGFLAGPGESVADCSKTVAEALARDDLDRLKAFASDETKDDVVRWHDIAHPKLEKERLKWPSKEASIQVITVEEDTSKGRGETEVFYTPVAGVTQTASAVPPPAPIPVASPGSSPGLPAGNTAAPALVLPTSFHLYWIKSGSHWLLDGRQSHAMAARSSG